jgi:hypothetical protein
LNWAGSPPNCLQDVNQMLQPLELMNGCTVHRGDEE